MTYDQLLQSKRKRIEESGFDVEYLPDTLKPFQQFCVRRALKIGRYALWEDCGLGKTRQQIIFANEIVKHTNKPALILCPLAVTGQTIKEGELIGVGVGNKTDIHIYNYQQLPNIDTSIYGCIVLDESSILKNFEGKYRNAIIETFNKTPYRLACSATGSPNDDMEIGNHSEFLGAMTRLEMLAMYFVHDGGETSKWRIKGHAQNDFWKFVASWAISLSKPSDIGFPDDGYILPGLQYNEHIITTETVNGFINATAVSATDFNAELRRTKKQRLEMAANIDASTNDQHLIWVKQDEEADLLKELLPNAIEVRGSHKNEYKEEMLLAFAAGEIGTLITKTSIAGFGMNFQKCHKTTFASPDFSFEKVYQGIRRFLRFGQLHKVDANIIVTDTMRNVIESFKRKEKQFVNMQHRMQQYMHDAYDWHHIETKIKQQIKIPDWL